MFAFEPDSAAVRVNKRLGDGQAYARVADALDQRVVGAVEPPEDTALLLRRHAAPLVGDGDHDAICRLREHSRVVGDGRGVVGQEAGGDRHLAVGR